MGGPAGTGEARLAHLLIAVSVLSVLTPACGGGNDGREDPSGIPSARTAIRGFDQARASASIATITRIALADPDAVRETALAELGTTDPDRRFAAVYALTMTVSAADPGSLEAVRGLLGSVDVTERLLAAGALASLGRREGIETLIAGLPSTEPMRNLDPPMDAGRYALANLRSLIDLGLEVPLEGVGPAEVAPAMEAWWREHGAELTWDADLGRYVEAGP